LPAPPSLLPIHCQPPGSLIATAAPAQPSRNTDTSVLPLEALKQSQAPINAADLPAAQPAFRGGWIVLSTVALVVIFGILRLVKSLNALRESKARLVRQAQEDALR